MKVSKFMATLAKKGVTTVPQIRILAALHEGGTQSINEIHEKMTDKPPLPTLKNAAMSLSKNNLVSTKKKKVEVGKRKVDRTFYTISSQTKKQFDKLMGDK